MPQDAFTIKYVAKELNELLSCGKVSKITQPERDLIVILIYTGKKNVKLEICAGAQGARISIGKGNSENPLSAPNFCMLLRKHLQNAEILKVECEGFERVVRIDFFCVSDFSSAKMSLYCELMGKYSNIFLVKDGIIVGALKTGSLGENTKRLMFSGAPYAPPAPQDKISPDDREKLKTFFNVKRADCAKAIADWIKGVSYATALEAVEACGEDTDGDKLYEYFNDGKISPCVTYANGEAKDFKVKSLEKEKRLFPTVLQAQTEYYDGVLKKRVFEEEKRKLLSAVNASLKKFEKRLADENGKLFECRGAETLKLKGELLTANLYAAKQGDEQITVINYYDENCGKLTIELDKTLSPAKCAQLYFKKYKKAMRTVESVNKLKAETEQKIDYLKSVYAHICAAECVLDLREIRLELEQAALIKQVETSKKTKPAAAPFRTFLIDGYKILAGRNNVQNDRLLKSVSGEDIWLHAKNYHSSHVVIICDGREIPETVIKKAAEICAYYSAGRGGGKIEVDYTKRKFVKKPPKTCAGYVIYTDFKTILTEPAPHAEFKEDDVE